MNRPVETPASPAIPTHGASFWFEASLVFLVSFVAGGFPAPGVNEAHYLCRLTHYWDASYCRGDLFLESPDAHFTVVWLFGWVTRFVSLDGAAWLGRALSWGLLAVAWRRLVGRLTTATWLAPLGAALLVFGTRQTHFAGEWLVGGFEAKSLAYGFVLLALTEAIAARWNRCWLLLGAASGLHALVGGWSVVALAIVWLVRGSTPSSRAMLPGLLGGGLLSLAGVVPALALNWSTPPEVVAEANKIYVYFRLPHHLAPLTKPASWITERAGRHAAALLALALATAATRRRGGQGLRLLIGFAWAAEAISLTGLAISLIGWNDRAWSASLLRYYWHRLADIAVPLAVAAAAVGSVGAGLAQRRPAAAWAATLLFAGMAIYFGGMVWQRGSPAVAPANRSLQDLSAWIAMCDWIEATTEPDAVFLVPRSSLDFKWRAQRAEVVTHKDIPQDAASMVVWRARLSDVFQIGEWTDGSPRWTPSLADLGAERLRELGRKYGAAYALNRPPRRNARTPLRRQASLPIAHRVGPYTLYRLDVGGR